MLSLFNFSPSPELVGLRRRSKNSKARKTVPCDCCRWSLPCRSFFLSWRDSFSFPNGGQGRRHMIALRKIVLSTRTGEGEGSKLISEVKGFARKSKMFWLIFRRLILTGEVTGSFESCYWQTCLLDGKIAKTTCKITKQFFLRLRFECSDTSRISLVSEFSS